MKVFLCGTCNESTWRDELIKYLPINYFNPVVKDWTPECQAKEIEEREKCDYVLYTITPKMKGVYSIAEAVEDSIKRPKKTLFCVLEEDDETIFDKSQLKSLQSVSAMIKRNGGQVFNSLEEIIEFFNLAWLKGFQYRRCETIK